LGGRRRKGGRAWVGGLLRALRVLQAADEREGGREGGRAGPGGRAVFAYLHAVAVFRVQVHGHVGFAGC